MNQPSALKTLLLAMLLVMVLALPAMANTGTISGVAYVDINLDSQPGANERLVDNVEVALYQVEGDSSKLLSTAITGADGAYQFSQLPAGDYYLTASLTKGLVFGPYDATGSAMLPASGRSSKTPTFRLEGGSVQKNIGATAKSTYISVVAFGDENMNGGRFSSEPLLRDVLIEVLFDAEGETHVVASATTNKDGVAKISDLSPGTFRIAATMPSPYIIGPLGQKMTAFYNTVNPSESNRGESNPFPLTTSIGLGVGGVKSGSLRGSTWFDQNMNGVMDAGEAGASGLVLTLTNPELGVTRTLTVDNQNEYEFNLLQAGSYVLSAALPDGQMFTLPGGDSLFTSAYKTSQDHQQTVAEGGTATVKPIGVMPATSLEVVAFHDSNYNGMPDEGEPPFAGAEISVLEEGKVVASTQTDAQGIARIARLRGGNVSLKAKLPADQAFSVAGAEGGNAFSAKTAVSELSIEAAVPHGENTRLHTGVTLPGVIAGSLFEDNNTSGVFDQGEGMLPGFTVQALDQDGNVVAESTTNNEGAYELQPLLPGDYQVRVQLQSPYIFSSPSQTGAGMENKITSQTPEYGLTDALHVAPGQRAEQVDAGAFKSGVVNGQVLLGDERDGFDGAMGGLPGVLVELTDENNDPVSDFTIAKTDEAGNFSLKGALPGTYKLRYTLPAQAKFSQPMQEEDSWLTEPFTVSAGEVRSAEAVFAVKTVRFSGSAINDLNLSGTQDEGDSALAGVSLRLYSDEGAEHKATSDENGAFAMEGIRPGSYALEVTLPEGLAIGFAENSPVTASIGGSATADLDFAMGEVVEGRLIAAVKPLALTGTAFYDNNMNGAYDADTDTAYAPEVLLRHQATGTEYPLTIGQDGNFALPAVFPGEYQMSLTLPEDHLLTLPEGASQTGGKWQTDINLDEYNANLALGFVQYGSISGTVWNMDGSSKNVDGLVISLKRADGSAAGEATSANGGSFHFDKLYPGEYRLFSQLPDTYRFARSLDTQQRPSLITSDSSPTGADASPITLAMGEKKTDQDIGMGAVGKLGDIAWLDLNANGMQDAGEPGVPEIGISLYQYGQLITSATTDAYGRYLISDLFPGNYTVVVTMPKELKPTLVQTQFPLVASVIVPSEGHTGRADNVLVPSGGRNLNCDFGFVLVNKGQLPASMQHLPVKDWSPVVDVQPQR